MHVVTKNGPNKALLITTATALVSAAIDRVNKEQAEGERWGNKYIDSFQERVNQLCDSIDAQAEVVPATELVIRHDCGNSLLDAAEWLLQVEPEED